MLPQPSHSSHSAVRTEWSANNPTERFVPPSHTCCTWPSDWNYLEQTRVEDPTAVILQFFYLLLKLFILLGQSNPLSSLPSPPMKGTLHWVYCDFCVSCQKQRKSTWAKQLYYSIWLQVTPMIPPHVISCDVTLALIKTWCVPNLMSCSWLLTAVALIISFGKHREGAEGVKQSVHWRWPIMGTKPSASCVQWAGTSWRKQCEEDRVRGLCVDSRETTGLSPGYCFRGEPANSEDEFESEPSLTPRKAHNYT